MDEVLLNAAVVTGTKQKVMERYGNHDDNLR